MRRLDRVGPLLATFATFVACGGSGGDGDDVPIGADGPDDPDTTVDGGETPDFGATDGDTPTGARDPVTCEEAAKARSYIGCDYWPTTVPSTGGNTNENIIARAANCPYLNLGIVVSNTGKSDADVTITGPNQFTTKATIPAGQAKEFELPYVTALANTQTKQTQIFPGGAYHLVSTAPLVVYEFNPYKFTLDCKIPATLVTFADAMLLSPTTALTGNYRVMGAQGGDLTTQISLSNQPSMTVTATAPGTTVTLKLGSQAGLAASMTGTPVPATAAGGTVTFTLANAGDVAQLVGTSKSDFSGSLLKADKPVQVLVGAATAADAQGVMGGEYEEALVPAETLGKHYVVTTPPAGKDGVADHVVRIYGNVDGTTLTYSPAKPDGCPDKVDAGQVADCGVVSTSFDVKGSAEFGVMSFVRNAVANSNPTTFQGSQTSYQSVEQFRTKYVFMGFLPDATFAGNGTTWANVTGPKDAGLVLNGTPVDTSTWKAIGSGPLGVSTIELPKTAGNGGQHILTAKTSIGVQIVGKDYPTSFAYPAGLNLDLIAPIPPN